MNEMQVYEPQDIVVSRPPEAVLAEAQKAARALADIVSKKKKPVMMNGEQYLEFEDWQTCGKFYGLTAKVVSTGFIEYGGVQGFEAKADVIRLSDGMVISSAESMCLNDEPNWKGKPLFQLKSMAQTRACSKALRNVLAWVVVLAGYKPTPAEEMTGNEFKHSPQKQSGDEQKPEGNKITVGIQSITQKSGKNKNGKEYTKYTVTDTNGGVYSTFDRKFADSCAAAREQGLNVIITFKAGQYGNDILAVEHDVPSFDEAENA